MPISLDALVRKAIPLTVDWAGEKVNLRYRPYCEVDEDQARSEEEKESALRQDLARLVVDWDITDGGKPFPVDAHEMRRLPHPLLVLMRQQIWADMYPNLRSGGNTAAT